MTDLGRLSAKHLQPISVGRFLFSLIATSAALITCLSETNAFLRGGRGVHTRSIVPTRGSGSYTRVVGWP
jgi:hypothetical protein